MPIYQYLCQQCGHSMEALQKMSDGPLLTCPECQKDALKKQLTAAAFQLKGTGWYATDFKNAGKPVAKPKANETKSKTDASRSTSDKGSSETTASSVKASTSSSE